MSSDIRHVFAGVLCDIRHVFAGVLCDIRHVFAGVLCDIRHVFAGVLCGVLARVFAEVAFDVGARRVLIRRVVGACVSAGRILGARVGCVRHREGQRGGVPAAGEQRAEERAEECVQTVGPRAV